ncbi:Hypothetical protein Cul210932_0759 [Corynebacterium ulcerans]|nr:Hypothetical protein Cul210932_0759 [Corynebacterium ulcerans]
MDLEELTRLILDFWRVPTCSLLFAFRRHFAPATAGFT